jgi:hypothetical protein
VRRVAHRRTPPVFGRSAVRSDREAGGYTRAAGGSAEPPCRLRTICRPSAREADEARVSEARAATRRRRASRASSGSSDMTPPRALNILVPGTLRPPPRHHGRASKAIHRGPDANTRRQTKRQPAVHAIPDAGRAPSAWKRAVSASLLPFHGCRSCQGRDRALADARGSSGPGVSPGPVETPAYRWSSGASARGRPRALAPALVQSRRRLPGYRVTPPAAPQGRQAQDIIQWRRGRTPRRISPVGDVGRLAAESRVRAQIPPEDVVGDLLRERIAEPQAVHPLAGAGVEDLALAAAVDHHHAASAADPVDRLG